VKDERVALMRRGERRSSLFQSPLIQQQKPVGIAGGDGNPHILISDASSLYSVEEDELPWSLRRPSTQSVGAVIVAVCQSINQSINHAAGDAPSQFKATNRRRGHRLRLDRE